MLLHRMRLGFGVMVLSSLSISAYATTSTNTALPAGLSMNPQAAHALDKSSSTTSNERRREWQRLIALGAINLPEAPAGELQVDNIERLPASQDKAAPLPKMAIIWAARLPLVLAFRPRRCSSVRRSCRVSS